MLTDEQRTKIVDPIVEKVQSMARNRVTARSGSAEDIAVVLGSVSEALKTLSSVETHLSEAA